MKTVKVKSLRREMDGKTDRLVLDIDLDGDGKNRLLVIPLKTLAGIRDLYGAGSDQEALEIAIRQIYWPQLGLEEQAHPDITIEEQSDPGTIKKWVQGKMLALKGGRHPEVAVAGVPKRLPVLLKEGLAPD